MKNEMPEWFAAWSKDLNKRLDGIDARIDDLKEYVDERFDNLIVKNNLKT